MHYLGDGVKALGVNTFRGMMLGLEEENRLNTFNVLSVHAIILCELCHFTEIFSLKFY